MQGAKKRMIRSSKLPSKFTQKTFQTAFFGDEQIFKVKQLYNSHNDAVYVRKERRKVEEPEESRGARRKIILRI